MVSNMSRFLLVGQELIDLRAHEFSHESHIGIIDGPLVLEILELLKLVGEQVTEPQCLPD